MTPARCKRSTTWAAGALLALLGCVAASPSPARAASCAVRHYLADPGPGVVAIGLELLGEPGSDPAPAPAPPTPTPCGSWRCQGGVPAAPVPLVPIPSAQAEAWGVLAAVSASAGAHRAGLLGGDETSPRPIRRPGAVFHPPR